MDDQREPTVVATNKYYLRRMGRGARIRDGWAIMGRNHSDWSQRRVVSGAVQSHQWRVSDFDRWHGEFRDLINDSLEAISLFYPDRVALRAIPPSSPRP